MQYLLISRHGNTFAPTDKVIWVGANNDLPLVESGNNQATNLAQALNQTELAPQIIYTGPLKRTFSYAQIVRDKLSKDIPVQIDNRLREIDYGKWSGLTDQEIKEQFGDEELDRWRNKGIWPASFNGSEQETIDAVLSFADDAVVKQPKRKLTLAITSNGCIKYFLKLVADQENKLFDKWKVATGQVSLLSFSQSSWQLIAWNESPHFVCNILKAKIKDLAGIA